MYSLLPDIIENERGRKSASGGAQVNLQDNAIQEKINPNNTEEACLERDFCEPDDIYDGEISLGTKPGVPAEYESICKHEAQLQAKETSLQEALNEISKLKSRNNRLETAMMETRKNAYEAEEKARMKGQDLTIAKKAIINNNAQITNLEHRNTELYMMLSDTLEKLDKTHDELSMWKAKYADDYKEAVRLGNLNSKLGADLFFQMTQLEVIIANACGRFFFGLQDKELKRRAVMNLPLDLACRTMQLDLFESSKDQYANDVGPVEKWTAVGGLRLAIEAPTMNAETDELTRVLNSEMEKLPHVMDQETRVVDESGYHKPTTPEKSIPETNLGSDSEETSLSSPIGKSNSEAGRSDSATSNELEQGSSMCEDSNAEMVFVPEVEASSNDEGEKLRSLLGYNPNPEEPFYPQYEKASDLPASTEIVEDENLPAPKRYNPELEGLLDSQEPQSPSEAMESPLRICYESDMGPEIQWLLGYNPEPEEAFYPQYSQNQGHDEEQTSTTEPYNEPIFDMEPENNATAAITLDSDPLAVDVSFADTSKDFKNEIVMRIGEDTASTDSTELEQKSETISETIFTPQIEESSPAATTPATRSSSIDITFTNTSQPFKAGAKPRMTRSQRREAAVKAQAEAMVAEQKAKDRIREEERGKLSRQERRAAERKAWKAALKEPRRNIVRF